LQDASPLPGQAANAGKFNKNALGTEQAWRIGVWTRIPGATDGIVRRHCFLIQGKN
jgi:hypothetical protein